MKSENTNSWRMVAIFAGIMCVSWAGEPLRLLSGQPKCFGVVETVAFTNQQVSLRPAAGPQLNSHHYGLSTFQSLLTSNSSPAQYILSGQIVSLNSGLPAHDSVPIFFHSSLHGPKLAGITDAYGRFCFRANLKEDQRDSYIQMLSVTNAAILVGKGSVHMFHALNGQLELTNGLVRRYDLAKLVALEATANSTNKPANPTR